MLFNLKLNYIFNYSNTIRERNGDVTYPDRAPVSVTTNPPISVYTYNRSVWLNNWWQIMRIKIKPDAAFHLYQTNFSNTVNERKSHVNARKQILQGNENALPSKL